MNGLLNIERIVIESLSQCPKTEKSLAADTSLNQALISKIIEKLTQMKIIGKQNDLYYLDRGNQKEWIDFINNDLSIRDEFHEMFQAIINYYFDKKSQEVGGAIFRLQKVWMSQKEERLYNSYLFNLQSFVESLKRKKKDIADQKICQQKVTFWGHISYRSIIEKQLNYYPS